jgi:hypothetical protein
MGEHGVYKTIYENILMDSILGLTDLQMQDFKRVKILVHWPIL